MWLMGCRFRWDQNKRILPCFKKADMRARSSAVRVLLGWLGWCRDICRREARESYDSVWVDDIYIGCPLLITFLIILQLRNFNRY
jgi:hypothetical protein